MSTQSHNVYFYYFNTEQKAETEDFLKKKKEYLRYSDKILSKRLKIQGMYEYLLKKQSDMYNSWLKDIGYKSIQIIDEIKLENANFELENIGFIYIVTDGSPYEPQA